MKLRRRDDRRGNALVLMVVFLVPMMAFLALSVDVGLLAIARTQCQDASDLAALAGVRMLNGNTANGANNNYSAVAPAAQQAATANKILWSNVQSSQVAVTVGRYAYNASAQQFQGNPSGATGNWSMVQATTTANVSSSLPFAKVLGISVPSLQTQATAVHRPRDIAIILDFSGSMRFGTFLGYSGTGNQFCTLNNTVNNYDTNVPSFGHYSAFGAGSMYATSYTAPFLPANVTATTSDGRPPLCADFYQDSNGTPAFTAASSGYATTPGGDNYLTTGKNTSSTYAQTLAQMLGITSPTTSSYDSTFETKGYQGYTNKTFNGYTQGPGYYGKTFFIWPPDPLHDWRSTYFNFPSNGSPDNSLLWDSNGNWQAPSSSTYSIDYNAILNFITNVGPNPFPSTLQSGKIVYYTSIPTTISTTTWPPSDLNQRFWKDYIDYVLGLSATGVNQYTIINNAQNGDTGYGQDVTWGTINITRNSSLGNGQAAQLGVPKSESLFAALDSTRSTAALIPTGLPGLLTGATQFGGWGGWGGGGSGGGGGGGSGGSSGGGSSGGSSSNPPPYMCYADNPTRPLLNFWFGPLTMIDFLDNYKLFQVTSTGDRYCWWPGTCHESPMYECKLGIQAALNDIQSNHPNDYVSLIMFSMPMSGASDTSGGRFNCARVGLGQDYSDMIASLWYPAATVTGGKTTVTPYDSDNLNVPRAFGGTCYSMALMQAYNQFSSSSTCSSFGSPAGLAGGNGRPGAQKIVIFETDGAPNATASAGFTNSVNVTTGVNSSYYNILYTPGNASNTYPTGVSGGGWSDNNSSAVTSQITTLCKNLCNTASPATGLPGFSTASHPVLIHCISFGPLVDSTTIQTLQNMQSIGSVNDGMPSYKIINGSQSYNVTALQTAFTNILESTVPVSLIQ
ncbi:MAG TPA: pilus assembly protein TadG-related protein [Pirellulales bacterium]|nr:pilus assembly protein TadG-related protein [Pirellulales bacterium]